MSEMNGKICEIDVLRDKLEGLIKEKHGNLLDSEVVSVSKELNEAINRYSKEP
ncbi:Spo0E like sporulation regulatory protein [Clostridium acidisoli DSM 12555]|jgi:hypothetical protein|uniref:Spo0E like sporulation regulatory protein n=1 Tax=Clostridium acidisoli DSM 12555 TaxID=1121291 RepID=A0A1W1X7H6_9CLOT|nr:aspartyl-phosphate phosphatase Spo0E family protein [Clostridium acidisoli]SMC19912.1 Spo0E like sporulation regulatory protein [Clostridium acidisoli DSM 12555]